MNLKNFISHGDVILRPISQAEYEKLAKTAKKVEHKGEFVLALGEVSFHRHLLTATPDTLEVLELPDGRGRIIKVSENSVLTHQEHRKLEVQPDYYIQLPERELNHFEGSIERRVLD